MLWNDEGSNFHMAERFLWLWQVIRRAHQTLWDWTQTRAEVGKSPMISISPASLCPIFCTVIQIPSYFIKRMMNVRLSVRLSVLLSNHGISLLGFSSSSSSILARRSLGNSNPTRRAVRLTFSSCSIPTDGLYRSNNVCHQQFARTLIWHYTSVDFEDTAERRTLPLFVVRAQTLWSQRQCVGDYEMHDSGVSIMQDGELVETWSQVSPFELCPW